MPASVYRVMKTLVGIAIIITISGCAKLMEDQPGTADSTHNTIDTAALETAATKSPKVPERFLEFFSQEFTGTIGATGGGAHTLDVKTVMDVSIDLHTDSPEMTFIIKKDGLDITEGAAREWKGRLVPGKYLLVVLPGPHLQGSVSYSLSVKES